MKKSILFLFFIQLSICSDSSLVSSNQWDVDKLWDFTKKDFIDVMQAHVSQRVRNTSLIPKILDLGFKDYESKFKKLFEQGLDLNLVGRFLEADYKNQRFIRKSNIPEVGIIHRSDESIEFMRNANQSLLSFLSYLKQEKLNGIIKMYLDLFSDEDIQKLQSSNIISRFKELEESFSKKLIQNLLQYDASVTSALNRFGSMP